MAAMAGLAVSSLPAASWAATSGGRPAPAAVPQTGSFLARSVLAWGTNTSRQLGNGDDSGTPALLPVAVRLPVHTRITQAQSGCNSGYALTTGGQLLAWGTNAHGELGDGRTGAFRPTPVLVKLPAGPPVTSISAGEEHSLAVTASGSVLAWGSNTFRELGDGHTETFSNVPVMVTLPRRTRVRSVSAGFLDSMALTTTRQVLTWGINQHGELGTGSTAPDSAVPVPASLPAGTLVVAISAGNSHDLALTATGRVLNWGRSSLLGIGSSSSDLSLPVRAHLPAGLPAIGIGSGSGAGSTLVIVPSTRF
jgi:alpha-tubulin suppressor-like RCC1 family protein